MLIDWFTVLAQIINFLVLVFLLRRFLYRPLLNAMQEREERIASRFREAETLAEEAEREVERCRQKQQEIDERREELLSRAREEAESLQEELMSEARWQSQQARSDWQEQLQRERSFFMRSLRQRAGRELLAISRRALADMADAELEQRMVGLFIQHLRELDDERRAAMAESVHRSDDGAVIHSAFALPAEARQEIAELVRRQLAADDSAQVRFQESPDLIAGFELRAEGRKLAWTLDSYLEGLEESLNAAFRETIQEETEAEH